MQLTLEQASFLRDFQVSSFEGEIPATKACLLAMPTATLDYRPDPKSKTALELGWHIVFTDIWFLQSLAKGEFGMDDQPMPASIKTGADLVAWYERELAKALPPVKAMGAAALNQPLDFFGMFKFPAVCYLNFLVSHCIHHRGQLSAYLRAMGGKVPSIYGPSADTPMPTPGA